MNRGFMKSPVLGLALAVIVLLGMPAMAQTINVTVRLNTSTNQDTVMEHHTVQIRGEADGAVTPSITWGVDTGLIMTNVGGDCWETTFQIAFGAVMKYKFWTGFNASTGTFFGSGWEGPLVPVDPLPGGGNRLFVAGTQDTTLDLQFYNGTATERDQYWRPYEEKADSFAVYLRVNMAARMESEDFVPGTDGPVAVRGSAPLLRDTSATWNEEIVLTQEEGSVMEGSFYSGVGYIAKSDLTPGTQQSYKFVYTKNGSVVWESISDRSFFYDSASDTTIVWEYFNNVKPTGGNIVTATLIWQMNTRGLEKLGLFDRNVGDKIVIDGAKAWSVTNAIQLNYTPLLGLWIGQESFTKAPGANIEYKAVLLWDASRVDTGSPNYIPGLDLTVPLRYWEAPSPTGTGNRNYTFGTSTEQMIPGDLGFDYQFFNGLPEEGVIEKQVTVTFRVNMAPAADIATNPSKPLFRPGIDTAWVEFQECLLPLTQGEGIYTNTERMLWDPDGDLVYTGSLRLNPPFPYDVAFRVRYTSASGTIVNGGGFQKGRIYYQFIHPTKIAADGTITWPNSFSFAVVDWMNSNLTVEDPPDLWTPMDVAPVEGALVETFSLAQNYPNPFNPATTVFYQVPRRSMVRINVYNLLGQPVTNLVDEQKAQGTYTVQWNGTDNGGKSVQSGLYFIKMMAGTFEQIRKVTLIR